MSNARLTPYARLRTRHKANPKRKIPPQIRGYPPYKKHSLLLNASKRLHLTHFIFLAGNDRSAFRTRYLPRKTNIIFYKHRSSLQKINAIFYKHRSSFQKNQYYFYKRGLPLQKVAASTLPSAIHFPRKEQYQHFRTQSACYNASQINNPACERSQFVARLTVSP